MKTTIIKMVILLICITFFSGCWRGSANMLNYNSYKAFSNFPNEAYDEIGRITESGWASYVGFCGTAARNAMAKSLTIAEARGGNALADVKWLYNNSEFKTPVCTDYFLIYYWGAKAEVSATTIKIKAMPVKESGIFYFDKNKPKLEEADRIIAEMKQIK